MKDHEIMGSVERELVSTAFLAEAQKRGRKHRPYYPPPKKPSKKISAEQRKRYAATQRERKRLTRLRRLVLGIVKPKDEQERAWLAAQQKEAA